MIEYIKGKLVEKHPTHAIVETAGLGYKIHISVLCAEAIGKTENVQLLIHELIREDTHELFGFVEESEREMFRLLISVSGIGVNTARIILSGMATTQLANVILQEEVAIFKKVKGVGPKTAQRIIIELKDKVVGLAGSGENSSNIAFSGNTNQNDALTALLNLGFERKSVLKAFEQIEKKYGAEQTVEEYIRYALQIL